MNEGYSTSRFGAVCAAVIVILAALSARHGSAAENCSDLAAMTGTRSSDAVCEDGRSSTLLVEQSAPDAPDASTHPAGEIAFSGEAAQVVWNGLSEVTPVHDDALSALVKKGVSMTCIQPDRDEGASPPSNSAQAAESSTVTCYARLKADGRFALARDPQKHPNEGQSTPARARGPSVGPNQPLASR